LTHFYADEQFPRQVTELLRSFGHDVLTVQEAGNRGLPDEAVLAFATSENRVVLTLNRRHFIRLHGEQPDHAGIVVCKDDADREGMAIRICESIATSSPLAGQLIRVNRSE
jgi:predicted nuclease of predicted toxin-antitoxin system